MRVFDSFSIKGLDLKNRIVMPPLCMYISDQAGYVQDFHLVHYGTRAIGGVGLIIQEATAVTPAGRISGNDLGIWEDNHIAGLSSIVRLIHSGGAKAGIQLGHAGRKCKVSYETNVAPSSLHFNDVYPIPHELDIEEINEIVKAFGQAAKRAAEAGYDVIEIHGAHGYLVHEFLSPLSNRRSDNYGGSLENRIRFLKEVITAIRRNWPSDKVLQLRLSAADYIEGGLDIHETIRIINHIKQDVDIFHVSSGGLIPVQIDLFPGYQVGFAEAVRKSCDVPTIAVGLITKIEQVEEIIGNGRADLVALGRELMRNPYWPIRHSGLNKFPGCSIPVPYELAWK